MAAISISLSGKITVITGGGGGIGFAIARLLARAGATTVIADLSEAAATRAAAEIESTGGDALSVVTDVSDETSVRTLFSRIADRFDGLDVLVNAAAWIHPQMYKPVVEQPLEEWDRTQSVNFRGAYLCCRAALPLLEARRGNIINVTSVAARVATPLAVAYNASKAALEHMTRSMANEYARRGVRVNAIAPGWVDTPGTAFSIADREATAREVDRRIPMGRLGTPEEIAPAALYLASDELASYVTGSTIGVDGGWLLQ